MSEVSCRREGVRVTVHTVDHIEAIVYSENGVPEFCEDYEINLGGLKVNTHFSTTQDKNVKVSLFDDDDNHLEVASTVVSSSITSSVIKFGSLNEEQHATLSLMLTLQQPVESD